MSKNSVHFHVIKSVFFHMVGIGPQATICLEMRCQLLVMKLRNVKILTASHCWQIYLLTHICSCADENNMNSGNRPCPISTINYQLSSEFQSNRNGKCRHFWANMPKSFHVHSKTACFSTLHGFTLEVYLLFLFKLDGKDFSPLFSSNGSKHVGCDTRTSVCPCLQWKPEACCMSKLGVPSIQTLVWA